MRGLWLRVLRALRWRTSERDIDEELRFHVEMEADELMSHGLSPAEARRRALIALGGEDRWREEVRAARGTAWIEDIVRDVRIALRGLARAPGFAAAAIGTIALGVGASTALYSVVDQVVLSPLPYPESDELVTVWARNGPRGIEEGMTSWPNFVDWREGATTFEGLATVAPAQMTLTGGGDPEELLGASVSRGFFELVGAPLALGRSFRSDEGEGDFASVVVLSHELFARRFGADPSIIGRTIQLNDAMYEVVGVTEPGRRYPRKAQLWTPQAFGPGRQWREPRGRLWLPVIGRLAEGVRLPVAQQEMDGIAARLQAEFPNVNRGVGIRLEPLRETIVGDIRPPFLALLGAVSVVLLIAVVNVANLLLARGTARARELAARLALGAGRGRMVQQALVHSAVLGGLGGLLGGVLASLGVTAFVAAAPPDLPRLEEIGVDGIVLALALATALGASVVFGLAPAFHATRVDPGSSLRAAERGSSSAGLGRLRGVFVGGQFGLAFVLLVGSGLLMRSFLNLRAVDPGFDPERVLSVGLSLPPNRYPDAGTRRGFYQGLLEDLAALPGIEAVGTISTLFVSDLPMVGTVTIESRPDQFEPGTEVSVIADVVSPNLFSAVGMEIVAGRGLEETDGPDDLPVAVVNETFARLYLDGLDPVGERYTWLPDGEDTYWFTIVGMVADARRSGLDGAIRPAVFTPLAQSSSRHAEVLLRTTSDPLSLAPAVRAVVGAIDIDLPVSSVRTLERAMSDSLAPRRFVARILGVFALAALALAAIGIFGVMAYVVGRRTREIGIRVALGAARPRVLGDVLREGMLQAGSGLLAGTLASLPIAHFARSHLYGIEPTDPVTFGVASVVLLLVAAVACIVPARRAARVDAMVALREE